MLLGTGQCIKPMLFTTIRVTNGRNINPFDNFSNLFCDAARMAIETPLTQLEAGSPIGAANQRHLGFWQHTHLL